MSKQQSGKKTSMIAGSMSIISHSLLATSSATSIRWYTRVLLKHAQWWWYEEVGLNNGTQQRGIRPAFANTLTLAPIRLATFAAKVSSFTLHFLCPPPSEKATSRQPTRTLHMHRFIHSFCSTGMIFLCHHTAGRIPQSLPSKTFGTAGTYLSNRMPFLMPDYHVSRKKNYH